MTVKKTPTHRPYKFLMFPETSILFFRPNHKSESMLITFPTATNTLVHVAVCSGLSICRQSNSCKFIITVTIY